MNTLQALRTWLFTVVLVHIVAATQAAALGLDGQFPAVHALFAATLAWSLGQKSWTRTAGLVTVAVTSGLLAGMPIVRAYVAAIAAEVFLLARSALEGNVTGVTPLAATGLYGLALIGSAGLAALTIGRSRLEAVALVLGGGYFAWLELAGFEGALGRAGLWLAAGLLAWASRRDFDPWRIPAIACAVLIGLLAPWPKPPFTVAALERWASIQPVFNRFTGQGATTGHGETIRPGGPLRVSDRAVLRVSVNPPEAVSCLYLRSDVLYDYAGASGKIPRQAGAAANPHPGLDPPGYRVTLTALAPIPVLPLPQGTVSAALASGQPLAVSTAGLVQRGLAQGVSYHAIVAAVLPSDLPDRSAYELPASLPSRLRELALAITADAGDPIAKALAVQDYLRRHCVYDERAPVTPAGYDFVDYFVFVSRRGYCSHFASAAVVLLRLGGLPARWVQGYAVEVPGERGTATVRDRHSHAWAETYVEGLGWFRLEPTPSRPAVARPLDAVASGSPDAGVPAPPSGPVPAVPGGSGWWPTLAALALLLVVGTYSWLTRAWDPQRAFTAAERAVMRLGLPRPACLGPVDWLTAIAPRLTAAQAAALEPIVLAYHRWRYGPPTAAPQLDEDWRRFREAFRGR